MDWIYCVTLPASDCNQMKFNVQDQETNPMED